MQNYQNAKSKMAKLLSHKTLSFNFYLTGSKDVEFVWQIIAKRQWQRSGVRANPGPAKRGWACH
jgi:hypothetical protein